MTSSVPVDKTTNSYISSYYDVLLDDITSEYVLVDERVNYVPQNNYVPQGIALVGDYFLTSNFDYYKDKNSMICVIDKDGKLVHKCMLDHDAHVGGIAYDEVNGLLFVTGYSGYILAYDIEDILHKDKVTAKYSNINVGDGLSNYVYPWVNSASFISIHDNELLVGNFSLRNTGKVKRYKYSIVEDEIKLEYVSSFKIPDMVQGITFYKKDDKYYTCFMNGGDYDLDANRSSSEFSSHKYISGFSIIKNMEQGNYKFTVHYEGSKVVGFDCAPFRSAPTNYVVDDVTFIEDVCVVFYTKQTFTIDELEVYFKNENEEVPLLPHYQMES